MRLVVTTTGRAGAEQVARARRLGLFCDAAVEAPRRGSLRATLTRHGARLAYVVGPTRDELRDGDGRRLFVHEGLLAARLHDGGTHPLVRAIAPTGLPLTGPVIDATLGLAADALHLAALGVHVTGIEASPVLAALAEEGLERLGASGVRVLHGAARDVLAGMPDDGAAVVYLDPMFDQAAASAPGWALLRGLACHDPPTPELIRESIRVASARVVLKVRAGHDPGAIWPQPEHVSRVRGRAVDYLIAERDRQPTH